MLLPGIQNIETRYACEDTDMERSTGVLELLQCMCLLEACGEMGDLRGSIAIHTSTSS